MRALTERVSVNYRDLVAAQTSSADIPVERLSPVFKAVREFPSARSAIAAALSDAGLGTNDRVLIPGYTCHALVAAVKQVATPVFIDIDPSELNMDLSALAEAAPTASAVIPVHLFGNVIDMTAVSKIAEKHDLVVIEDAAQAIGATIDDPTVAANSDYCVFSFRFSKEVTSHVGGLLLGDEFSESDPAPPDRSAPLKLALVSVIDSMLATLPGGIYEPIRRRLLDPLFRATAETVGDEGPRSLSEFQRSLVAIQLERLSDRVETRREHAQRYGRMLSGPVSTPPESPKHTYFRYSVLVPANRRDQICQTMRRNGIGVSTMYSYCVAPTGECENAEQVARRVINLPIHADLTKRDIKHISSTFNRVVQGQT